PPPPHPQALHSFPTRRSSDLVRIESPMVGTFYRSSQPGAAPFIEEGDPVAPGQTLCILEAMKLMNEIKADIEGIVRKIHVENARSEEHTSELQSRSDLVCRLL